MAVDTRIELGTVEPELGRMVLQVGRRKTAGVGEKHVVVRPEFSLIGRTHCSLGGRPGIGMVRQRVVPVYEADAIAVCGKHLLDGWVGTLAVRALEIGELDNLHRRVCRSARRAV